MKKKERAIVLKNILLALGDDSKYFQAENNLAFAQPIGNCYRGIYIASDRWEKDAFYVETFFCPLCLLASLVYFNFGKRIRSEIGLGIGGLWKKEGIEDIAAIIKNDELPALLYTCTDEKLLRLLNTIKCNPTSLVTLEAKIILAARIGDMQTLQDAYQTILQNIDLDYYVSCNSNKVTLERCETIMQNCHDAHFIQDLTDKWKDETVKNLKLEPYLDERNIGENPHEN